LTSLGFDVRKEVELSLKVVVSVLIGLEVSIPPNPYKQPLILGLVLLICLKHDIPNKILKKLKKWIGE
jgi:hypothetical protein|tara:strand:+ start:2071 stop:2274 length:204 start_codon:yes stop_codon:yes gene_type:complete